MKKTVTILRHAKAEPGNPQQDDHERSLADRGVEAAYQMGEYLRAHQIRPDQVLCSTAVRARLTWQSVEESLQELPVEYNFKLYLASAGEMLNQLSALSESISHVMIIGHNPGLHQLSLKLAKIGDEDLLDTLMLKFPTCALASIELGAIKWADVHGARGALIRFITPKMLSGHEDD